MKRLHKAQPHTEGTAAMFSLGLVLLALVASACGETGKSFEELDQIIDESIMKLKILATEEVPSWPKNYEEMFGLSGDDDVAPFKPHTTKEQGPSAVWKVLLIVVVLLLALVGVLSTVYYLCVWRGGRMHYEPHKEVST